MDRTFKGAAVRLDDLALRRTGSEAWGLPG